MTRAWQTPTTGCGIGVIQGGLHCQYIRDKHRHTARKHQAQFRDYATLMTSSSSVTSTAVTQAREDIQALNLQYNGLCDECDALDITKGSLEADVRALTAQHADLLGLRDTVQADDTHKELLLRRENALGIATAELKTIRDAIDLETHNLQQTQDHHQSLAQTCAQLAEQHTGLVQQLPEVRADVAEARTTLAQLQQDKSSHEAQCCALQAANVQQKAEFARETQGSIIRQDNLQENVASLEDSMKNMQDRKDTLEQELLELIETATQRSTSNAHAWAQTQDQLKMHEAKIIASENEYIEAEERRATQTLHTRENARNEHELACARESALLQDIIITQQERQSAHEAELGAMRAQIDIVQIQLTERVTAKTEMDASLSALETMIAQTQHNHDEQQNALREIISAHETRQERNKSEHQTLTEQLGSAHEQLSGYALSVVEKEAELIALEDVLLKLRSDRIRHDDIAGQNLGQELTKAHEELDLCTLAVSGKQGELVSLEEDLLRLRNVYTLQTQKMQEEGDERAEQTCAEMDSHASLMLENQTEHTALQDDLVQLRGVCVLEQEQMDEQLGQARAQLATYTCAISEKKSDLAGLEDDLVQLRGVCVLEQEQMDEQLGQARAQLGTYTCAIAEKKSELAGLEDDLLQISADVEREMAATNAQKTIQLADISALVCEKQSELNALVTEAQQMRSTLDVEKTLTYAQFEVQKEAYQSTIDIAQTDLMHVEATLQQTRTDRDRETALQTQLALDLSSLRQQLAEQNSTPAEQQDDVAQLGVDVLSFNGPEEQNIMLAELPLEHLVDSKESSHTVNTAELCNPSTASTQLEYETVLHDIQDKIALGTIELQSLLDQVEEQRVIVLSATVESIQRNTLVDDNEFENMLLDIPDTPASPECLSALNLCGHGANTLETNLPLESTLIELEELILVASRRLDQAKLDVTALEDQIGRGVLEKDTLESQKTLAMAEVQHLQDQSTVLKDECAELSSTAAEHTTVLEHLKQHTLQLEQRDAAWEQESVSRRALEKTMAEELEAVQHNTIVAQEQYSQVRTELEAVQLDKEQAENELELLQQEAATTQELHVQIQTDVKNLRDETAHVATQLSKTRADLKTSSGALQAHRLQKDEMLIIQETEKTNHVAASTRQLSQFNEIQASIAFMAENKQKLVQSIELLSASHDDYVQKLDKIQRYGSSFDTALQQLRGNMHLRKNSAEFQVCVETMLNLFSNFLDWFENTFTAGLYNFSVVLLNSQTGEDDE